MPDPLTIVDLRSRPHTTALPISGGQGVAGSNPVVPTAVGSPLMLVVLLGQRVFLIPCGGRGVDLDCGGTGTICGPSVDTARFSRGYSHRDTVRCTGPGARRKWVQDPPGWWLRGCGRAVRSSAKGKRGPREIKAGVSPHQAQPDARRVTEPRPRVTRLTRNAISQSSPRLASEPEMR